MYLYFDTYGNLKEIINDEILRQGNDDVNVLYVYVEGGSDKTETIDGQSVVVKAFPAAWINAKISFKLPDDTITDEEIVDIDDNLVTETIPYSDKRDLKYFKDFQYYEFFKYVLPNGESEDEEPVIGNVLAESGLLTCSIGLIGSEIKYLGVIAMMVQPGAVKPDKDITLGQYNYLLHQIQNIPSAVSQLNSDYDNVPDGVIAEHIGYSSGGTIVKEEGEIPHLYRHHVVVSYNTTIMTANIVSSRTTNQFSDLERFVDALTDYDTVNVEILNEDNERLAFISVEETQQDEFTVYGVNSAGSIEELVVRDVSTFTDTVTTIL